MKRSLKIIITVVIGLSLVWIAYLIHEETIVNIEKIASFDVDSKGGIYENDAIKINFNAHKERTVEKIYLHQRKSNVEINSNKAYESALAYQISGLRTAFKGKMVIEFPISEKILDKITGKIDLRNRIFIVAEENAQSNTIDENIISNNILNTNIDWENKKIYAEYSFDKFIVNKTDNVDYSIAFHVSFYRQPVKKITSVSVDKSSGALFYALIDRTLNHSFIEELLNELEYQKTLLRRLKINLSGISYPIPLKFIELDNDVLVRYVKPSDFKGRGWFEANCNYFSKNKEHLAVNIEKKMKITISNQLAYMLDDIYGDIGWFGESFAVWFTPIALRDANYYSPDLLNSTNFIHTSLMFPESSDMKKEYISKYGAGMGFFVAYLATAYNDAFIVSKIFNHYKKNQPNHISKSILAVMPDKISEIYPDFLNTYIQSPQKLFPGITFEHLDSSLNHDDLKARIIKRKKYKFDWYFEHLFAAKNKLIKDDELSVGYKLKKLTARTLKLTLQYKNEEAKKEVNKKIVIKITNKQGSGTIVYKISDTGEVIRITPEQQRHILEQEIRLDDDCEKYLFLLYNNSSIDQVAVDIRVLMEN